MLRDLAHKGLIGTQILPIRGHRDLYLAQQVSSGRIFGSSGVMRPIGTHLARQGLSGLRFGSSGVTAGHQDLDLAHRGSKGLRFGSSGVIGTQIWLIEAHRGSWGLEFGSSGLIRGQPDSDLALQDSSGVIGTQN